MGTTKRCTICNGTLGSSLTPAGSPYYYTGSVSLDSTDTVGEIEALVEKLREFGSAWPEYEQHKVKFSLTAATEWDLAMLVRTVKDTLEADLWERDGIPLDRPW